LYNNNPQNAMALHAAGFDEGRNQWQHAFKRAFTATTAGQSATKIWRKVSTEH
jgi:hypothetical protein